MQVICFPIPNNWLEAVKFSIYSHLHHCVSSVLRDSGCSQSHHIHNHVLTIRWVLANPELRSTPIILLSNGRSRARLRLEASSSSSFRLKFYYEVYFFFCTSICYLSGWHRCPKLNSNARFWRKRNKRTQRMRTPTRDTPDARPNHYTTETTLWNCQSAVFNSS